MSAMPANLSILLLGIARRTSRPVNRTAISGCRLPAVVWFPPADGVDVPTMPSTGRRLRSAVQDGAIQAYAPPRIGRASWPRPPGRGLTINPHTADDSGISRATRNPKRAPTGGEDAVPEVGTRRSPRSAGVRATSEVEVGRATAADPDRARFGGATAATGRHRRPPSPGRSAGTRTERTG